MFTGKITSIRNPASIILLIDEDERTIDDGYFNPNPTQWGSAQCEMIATRHALKSLAANSTLQSKVGNQDDGSVGNVIFCDGHSDLLSRKDALRQKYTGNPVSDPTGF
jgi:prepilin-type processing-associated H-X9-DG protein